MGLNNKPEAMNKHCGYHVVPLQFGINRSLEVTNMTVQWRRDIEAALKEAEESNHPLLIDFSATPG
jgi:thiamine pyrophosphate-dependent acetolactate synthase large subunit-like protein